MTVTDTHAFIFYLIGEAPEDVRNEFKRAEAGDGRVYISTLVLAELHYSVERGRVYVDFDEVLDIIDETDGYRVVPFDYSVLRSFIELEGLNIHDRIIAGTAKRLDTSIMTKGPDIENMDLMTIW
jgi:predicted nucleic acid-binding protein